MVRLSKNGGEVMMWKRERRLRHARQKTRRLQEDMRGRCVLSPVLARRFSMNGLSSARIVHTCSLCLSQLPPTTPLFSLRDATVLALCGY